MLKVVVDTNVWVSSLYSDGKPRRIRERFEQGQFQLFFAKELLAECQEVLTRQKFAHRITPQQTERLLEIIRKRAVFVRLPSTIPTISADPDDDAFLLCAQIANCDYIVSGDPDLLDLLEHGQTKIVLPAQFLEILEQEQK